MLKKIKLKYVVGVVVVGAVVAWLVGSGALSVARNCSSDANRPCFELATANNMQASVMGGSKTNKLDKERGEKEFSECIKKESNRRGKEKKQTKICDAEMVTSCEGTWANDDKDNTKNEHKQIKKYEGRCEAPATEPKLSYSVTRIDSPQTSATIIPIPSSFSVKDFEVARIRISAPVTNKHDITSINLDVGGFINYPPAAQTNALPCEYFEPSNWGYFQNVNDPLETYGLSNSAPPQMFLGTFSSCFFWTGIGPIAPGTQKDFALKIKPSAQAKSVSFTLLMKPSAYASSPITATDLGIDYPIENNGYLSYINVYGASVDYFASNLLQFVAGQ